MEVLVASAWLIGGVVALNTWVFLLFGYDKWQARRNGQRVPEATLISLSFLGGWGGAKLGQRMWRHKTRKQPFGRQLNLAVGLNVALIAGAVVWLFAGG